jgi:hypothetical protein
MEKEAEIAKTDTAIDPQLQSKEAKTVTMTVRDLVKQQTWTSYVLVTIGMLTIMILTIIAARYLKEYQTKDLKNDFVLANNGVGCKTVPDNEKKAFIDYQKNEIVKFGESHRKTAFMFYGYFYSTFLVFSLFGVLSVISLAIIAKKGYETANGHLMTVFMVSTGIVVLYQGFFGVFQQKTNMDNNAKLYSGYSKLLTKIDTYCTTGKIPMIDPATVLKPQVSVTNTNTATNVTTTQQKTASFYITLDTDEFINYVGWQMEQLKAISITLDDQQIKEIDKNRFALP